MANEESTLTNNEDALIITEENFGEYFFDVRTHDPLKGQVMACYSATAELLDGMEKRNMMAMLQGEGKVEAICQVMRKLLHANDKDSIRIPRMIAEDLVVGMSHDEVAKKKYKFTVQVFFYTQPEYIPRDDPHWSSVSLLNLDQFLDKSDDDDDDDDDVKGNDLVIEAELIT